MADCRIVNASVKATVTNIENIASKFKAAGDTLVSEFANAIADMEGDSKDALVELFNNSYRDFVSSEEEGLPAMIKGLASLLEGNRQNFEDVDAKIAESIRGGGN